MRISVIIPSHSMARFLPNAIVSVLRQNVAVDEILVIDAQSDDGTPDVLRVLESAGAPIRRFECAAGSPSVARNVGLGRARFDTIGFLDADDLWPARKLERQLARLVAEPRVRMVSGLVTYFDHLDTEALEPSPEARTETLSYVHLGACLYQRNVFEQIGNFDETLTFAEDVDLLLRIREQDIPFAILNQVALYYRRHPDSMMARGDPRMHSDFRRALALSVGRRRAQGQLERPLPPLETYLEDLA